MTRCTHNAAAAHLSIFEKHAELGKEHEKRYELEELPSNAGKGVRIRQGMLADGERGYARIREQGKKYTSTLKFFPKNHEAETEISKEIFDALWPKTTRKQTKMRHKIHTADNNDWIVDVFEDGKIVAEVELPRSNGKVHIPMQFRVKKEVT